jgi:hypothetical protein
MLVLPNYSGVGYWKDQSLPGQKVRKTLSQPKIKLSAGSCLCHPSYVRSISRRITIQAGLGLQDPISKITKAKRVGAWFKW